MAGTKSRRDGMREGRSRRSSPPGVRLVAAFFAVGAAIAGTCAIALSLPGGPLEPIWRVNPRAKEEFGRLGGWSIPLMLVVATACAAAAVGLWRTRRWGWRLAAGLLVVSLGGDLVNGILFDRRALVGVPVALVLLAYLASRRVRKRFVGGAPVERGKEEPWTSNASS